jgi:integrase
MIAKSANGRWRVRIYHQGRQVATATFDQKKPAEIWESNQKTALIAGDWTDPKLGSTRLDDLIALFNESRPGTVSKHSFDTDEANLRLHVPDALKRRPINTIRKTDFEDVYGRLLRTHSRSTVSRFRDSVVAVFRYAIDRGYVSKNPALESTVPRGTGVAPVKVRPLNDAEMTQLLDTAREISAEYANLIDFARLTGARWGELAELRVADLTDSPIPAIVIARSKSDGYAVGGTKSRHSRVVPLVTAAQLIAQTQAAGKRPNDLLFQAPKGGRLNGGNLKRSLNWQKSSSGHRFHDLRHTAATNWISLGLDVKTVSEWLGHSSSAITHRVYAGWLGADANKAAVARLEEAMKRQAGGS